MNNNNLPLRATSACAISPPKRETLYSIQYLRGIAALMVVAHHARNPQYWLFNPLENYSAFAWGVDIFFFISGFIMYTAARHESVGEFARRRIVRIVPLYWIATFAFLVTEYGRGVFLISNDVRLHVIQSLLFIPHWNLDTPKAIFPFLIPGWTLNYEMFFYGIFAVGLALRRTVAVTSVLIILLVLGGVAFEPQAAASQAYTSPLLLEFLLGVWFAALRRRAPVPNLWYLFVAGVVGLLCVSPLLAGDLLQYSKILFSASIVVGMVSLEPFLRSSPLLKLLGDASYSIYLTHLITLGFVYRVWQWHIPLHGWPQFAGVIGSAIVASSVVGIGVYLCIEKPLLNRYSARRPPRTISA